MNPQESVVLVSGCKSFDNYELLRDFLQHYTQNLKDYVIVTDSTKPFAGFIKEFVDTEYHHVMSLPIDWNSVKKGELSLLYFQQALARAATHAVLFWDGSSDLKLLHFCNELLVDTRVIIYKPGLEASSVPFV